MSSETAPPRSFRLTVAITLAVLLVAAIGLGAVSATRGPRLETAEIDVTAAVTQPGQPLLIHTDHVLQPVAAADVTITPAAPFQVASDGVDIVVRFDTMLHYETSYVVQIRTRSAGTGSESTITFDFATPGGQVFTLERAAPGSPAGTEDLVMRRLLGAGDPETDFEIAYQGLRIQEYAVADPLIAVVSSEPTGIGSVTISSMDGSVNPNTIAEGSAFTQIRASGPDGVFGFLRTTQTGQERGPNRLLVYDPHRADPPVEVTGLGGKPLVVNNWRFVPGTRSVVVQDDDSSVFLIDPFDTKTVSPLGAHGVVHGFAPADTSLVVETEGRFSAIDLATGRTTPVPQAPLPDGGQLYGLTPVSQRDKVRLVAQLVGGSTRFTVQLTRGNAAALIYQPPDPTTWLQSVCVSPNGQFVAIEASPEGAAVDDHAELPGFSPTTTVVVELATKQVAAELPGFQVDWCE